MSDFSVFKNFGRPPAQMADTTPPAPPPAPIASESARPKTVPALSGAASGLEPLPSSNDEEDFARQFADRNRLLVPISRDLDAMPDFSLEGRDEDIRRMEEALAMPGKRRNIGLSGKRGVGKSALILGFVQRKNQADLSLDMYKRTFWRLNSSVLFENDEPAEITKQFKKALKDLSASRHNVLVIEDFGRVVTQLKERGSNASLTALMKALDQKSVQVIFEYSTADKAKLMADAPELAPYINPMEVAEPSKDEVLDILRRRAIAHKKRRGVETADSALREIADLTFKYPGSVFVDAAQPEKAISVLGIVISAFSTEMNSKPAELTKLEHDVRMARNEIESRAGSQDSADIEETEKLRKHLAEIEPRAKELRKEWDESTAPVRALLGEQKAIEARRRSIIDDLERAQARQTPNAEDIGSLTAAQAIADKALAEISEKMSAINLADKRDNCVMTHHVQATVSRLSGIDVGSMNENDAETLRRLDAQIDERVSNQPEAKKIMIGLIEREKEGLSEPGKPKGSTLFLGSSGVGKTELFLVCATVMTKDKRNFHRWDMSEFKDKSSAKRMIGADPGLIGFDEGGELTNQVIRHPQSWLLFDEMEKAHEEIFDLHLQILDGARLTSSKGELADFSDTHVGYTTNIGAQHFLNPGLSFEQASEQAIKDVQRHFRPEFLGRLDAIVCFRALTPEVMQKIARRRAKELAKAIAEGPRKIKLEIGDDEADKFALDHMDPQYGARSILKAMKRGPELELPRALKLCPNGGILKGVYNQATQNFEFINASSAAISPVPVPPGMKPGPAGLVIPANP